MFDAIANVSQMQYTDIPTAKPQGLPITHPFLNKDSHRKLIQYLQQRLWRGKEGRDARLDRLVSIDKNVAGWMRLSDEDKTRQIEKKQTGKAQALNMNLPLTFVHLDDMMTYFAQTFAPSRGMFYHTGKADETDQASDIVHIMNNHAIYAQYYREVLLGLYALLKYNFGGFEVKWSKDYGPSITKNPANPNEDVLTETLKWEGNRLEAVDVYNFFHDPLVPVNKIHTDGEYTATAKLKSYFWLQDKASKGVYYNCDEALRNYQGVRQAFYWRNPPAEANFQSDDSGGTDWKAILSEVTTSMSSGYEVVEIYIRINPVEFGLIGGSKQEQNKRRRNEVWRFTILNNTYIIDATYMNNIHGYLPHFMGVLNDDLMGTSQKSTAEILHPLQDFASFLLNTHVAATRKNIWNLTVYDPNAVDLTQIPDGEVAARIPAKPSAAGRNINEYIWSHGSTLETRQTMEDFGKVMDVINQFFPTQSLPSQIASIDRAVDSQVAAVQQGANRRQQKAARLIDDGVFRNVRFAMYYNIIQYQPDGAEITDYYSSRKITVDLAALRNTDLPYIIGQGLKAIDRQAAAQALQQIIFALIQAPQASQGIDLLKLIDYWTSMIDIDIDMKQFQVQQQPPADESQSPDAAAGGATSAPVKPVTDPASITSPIYG